MNEPRGEIVTYESRRDALCDDGVDEALDGGTCICGQVLDVDALRCECGRCVNCSRVLAIGEDCELCIEFLRQEQRAVYA